MKTMLLNQIKRSGLLMAAFSLGLLPSCNEKPVGPPQPEESQYALANVVGAFPSQTTYIQTISDLNMTEVNIERATEMPKGAGMLAYQGDLFMTTNQPAAMQKFTVSANGDVVAGGTLVMEGTRAFSTVQFFKETEAFATVYGANSIIKFNPATMQKTGEVDISRLMRPATPTLLLGGSIIRDGKMYVSVHYENNFAAVYDSAFVAIIDLPSARLEKLISDHRTKTIFGSGRAVEVFTMDAEKNIYVQAMGGGNHPSGILRIINGETRFDPGYFFDLNAVTGKQCYGLYHFGPGQTFTARLEEAGKFWNSTDPAWKFWKIDLANRTSGGELSAALPLVAGSSTTLMRKFDDQTILFNVASKNENALYAYDIATGSVQKKFTMAGVCRGLENLK